ncbi:uncharacterized protein [Agelaius tricolor]|uniref:uncharacterized protein n=1 Tax=Agelaius tricolor TaxID=9191 RepID=UPI0039F19648
MGQKPYRGIGEAPLRAAPLSPRASLRSPGVPRPRRLREPRCPRLRSALRRMLRGMDAPGMRRSGRLVHGCPEGMGQAGLGGHSPPCKVTRGAVLPEGRLSARALRPAASPRRGRRRGPGPGDAQRRRRRGCAACTASAALWAREEEEEKEEGGREREREAGGGREAGGEGALRGSAANFPSAAQQEQPPIPRVMPSALRCVPRHRGVFPALLTILRDRDASTSTAQNAAGKSHAPFRSLLPFASTGTETRGWKALLSGTLLTFEESSSNGNRKGPVVGQVNCSRLVCDVGGFSSGAAASLRALLNTRCFPPQLMEMQESCCAGRSTKRSTKRYLKGAKVGRKKVHLPGSDGCWSRAAHDGL